MSKYCHMLSMSLNGQYKYVNSANEMSLMRQDLVEENYLQCQ